MAINVLQWATLIFGRPLSHFTFTFQIRCRKSCTKIWSEINNCCYCTESVNNVTCAGDSYSSQNSSWGDTAPLGLYVSDSKVSCLYWAASLDTAISPAERRSSLSPEGEARERIKEGFVQRNGPASVQSVCEAGFLWNWKHLHNCLKNGWHYYDMK